MQGQLLRAQVLAINIAPELAAQLEDRGIAVRSLTGSVSLEALAEAGVELRRRHPKLPLLTLGPERLIGRFARLYPPLTDGLIATGPVAGVVDEIERIITQRAS